MNDISSTDFSNLKKLFVDEKQLRAKLRQNKQKQKENMLQYQSTCLKESFDKNFKTLYLTENLRTENHIDLTKSHTSSIYPTIKKSLKSRNSEALKVFLTHEPKTRNVSKNSIVKYETLNDFKTKTKEMLYLNYEKMVMKEACIREEEIIQNKVDFFKVNQRFYTKTRNFFENSFLSTFDKFTKLLATQKKRENEDLEILLEKKKSLDIEIKQMEYKMMKLNEALNNYKEYRNIMICIKETKTINELIEESKKIEESLKTVKFADGKLSKKGSINSNRHKSSYFRKSKINKRESIINSRNSLNPQFKSYQLKEKNVLDNYFFHCYINNKQIYSKSEEMLDSIKKLEYDNIALLNKYSSLFNSNSVKTEKNEPEIDVDENKINFEEKLKNKEILKEKHLSLTQKINNFKNENMMILKQNYLCKLLNKILQTYEKNIEKNLNQNYPKSSQISHLEMLFYIEEFTIKSIKKYEVSLSLYPNEVFFAEREIDRERKQSFARDQIKIKTEKVEVLRKNIMEKYHKVFILPKRKLMINSKPRNSLNFKEVVFKPNEYDIKDLLSYDNDIM